jgi:hypothetical protein
MANAIVMEDSIFANMARVHADGANLTQSDVSAIEYQIFYVDSDTAHTTATSLTVSSVIYDTLQTDARWDEDATGYNFRHDVGHGVLVDPSRLYKFEYKVTLADSSEFYLLFPPDPDVIQVTPVKSS